MTRRLPRKAVIKGQPVRKVKAFNVNQFAGKDHWHTCRDCRRSYNDNCDAPQTNGRCRVCVHGQETAYMAARAPRECCVGNCELVTDNKWREWMDLAGPGPWYSCRTCRRAHGFACTEQTAIGAVQTRRSSE